MYALRKAYEIELDSHVLLFNNSSPEPASLPYKRAYFVLLCVSPFGSLAPFLCQLPLKFIWEIVSNSKYPFALIWTYTFSRYCKFLISCSTDKVILCIGILVFLNSFPYPYLAEILLDLPLSLLFSKYLSIVIHLLPDQRQSMIPCQAGSFHRVNFMIQSLSLLSSLFLHIYCSWYLEG